MSLVEKAKIIKVVGRVKTFRGQGLRLDGHIEDRGPVPLIVWRNEFPCGIIDPYLIDGPEVDVLVDAFGDTAVGTLLPFGNQGPDATVTLMTALLKKADRKGQKGLSRLPVVDRVTPEIVSSMGDVQSKKVQELNRLLELSVDEPDVPPICGDCDECEEDEPLF